MQRRPQGLRWPRAAHRGHQRLAGTAGGAPGAPAWGCARRPRCPPPPHPSAACRQHRSANSPDATAATRGARGRDGPYPASHRTAAQSCEKDRTSSLCKGVQSKLQNSACWSKLTPKCKGQGLPHSHLEGFKAQNWAEMNKAASGLAEDGTAVSQRALTI